MFSGLCPRNMVCHFVILFRVVSKRILKVFTSGLLLEYGAIVHAIDLAGSTELRAQLCFYL